MLSKRQIKYFKSLQLKKYRDQERLFMVEGAKGVEEVLNSEFKVHSLMATEEYLSACAGHNGAEYCVKEEVLTQIGTFKSNHTAIAIVEMPEKEDPNVSTEGITLVLDSVRDPGNLGTIIRIADWYGISNIICSPDTADWYNPKVVNSTMGSFTRVNLSYTALEDFLKNVTVPIYGAVLNGKSIYEESLEKNALVVMGNESRGISREIQSYITHPVLIPGKGKAESLNVAVSTAVVLDNFFR